MGESGERGGFVERSFKKKQKKNEFNLEELNLIQQGSEAIAHLSEGRILLQIDHLRSVQV